MAASIATAEGNLKLAKLDAESKRLANQEGNDADYDQQVLKNRRELIMDEIIITVFLGIAVSTLGLMRLFRAFWGARRKG
jgi:hypothetical protein